MIYSDYPWRLTQTWLTYACCLGGVRRPCSAARHSARQWALLYGHEDCVTALDRAMEASQRRGGHARGVGQQDDDAAARLARYHLQNISMLITTDHTMD